MKEVIKGFFTGASGEGSSKRGIMWCTFFLWVIVILANLFKGYTLDVSLSVQLFSFLTTSIVLVFGEQIGAWIKANKETVVKP